jgi:ribosomal protein S18 acetylase RimI-like enzyme
MRLQRHHSYATSTFFNAISDNIVVGGFQLRRTCRQFWEIWSVWIKVEFRGAGFGKQMMALAVKLARRLKAPGLWLNCYARNVPAKAIYRRIGFTLKSIGFSMMEGHLALTPS